MKKLCVLFALFLLLGTAAGCETAPASPDTETTPAETTPAETTPPETKPAETEPAAIKPDIRVPLKYELRIVQPTAVTPVLDGKITPEEWGDTPDFYLNASVTKKKRTYCLDQFSGDGKLISNIEYFWRYDDEYIYTAVRVKEPEKYTTSAPVTMTGVSCTMTLHLGESYFRLEPEGEQIRSSFGNMCYGYTLADGVRYFEFAAPRDSVTNGKNSFLGFVEHFLTVSYRRNDTGATSAANLVTRSTPMYSESSFKNDVFVLAEGTPAPAPTLTLQITGTPPMEDVQLQDGTTLHFSDPIVLEQGEVGDQVWGHYNFPNLTRLTDGSILANWGYHQDQVHATFDVNPHGANHSVSRDNGETWTFAGKVTGGSAKNPMPNGKYFVGFNGTNGYTTDYLDKYIPIRSWNGYKLFFAEDIAEKQDMGITASEYDPVTGKTTRFDVTVNWPYMPFAQWPNKVVYPTVQCFAVCSRAIFTVDDELYLPLYFYGFDSFAASKEEAVTSVCNKYNIYLFKSSDCGRTWDLLTQIIPSESDTEFFEGLTEPEITVMPDGSFVMLIRTGSNHPCYITRSTDKGLTWSELERFDSIGVLPQLLTLPCGVTLASYGRPSLRFAATSDPDGAEWTKFDIPLSGGENQSALANDKGQSCYYTELIALDDNTALMIYADGLYPNKHGVPVKSILVRTITVIEE